MKDNPKPNKLDRDRSEWDITLCDPSQPSEVTDANWNVRLSGDQVRQKSPAPENPAPEEESIDWS
jgi:hypothetical protein